MSKPIAIVGMACRYPDAADPAELWTNVLAGRRAFRRFPDERMRLEDYWSADPAAPDRFYTRNAAVIEGYDFPRVAYKIAGSTFRTTDMTHWLALDTAAKAMDDAGLTNGEGLPKRNTAVVVGNSLTGEFTRANLMRLRWPYVRRVLSAALREHGWADGELAGFIGELETRYKSPFPAVDEDTLAGGLANTISGRICSEFGFMGGGFTVDGACSSSLLAVAISCNALETGQVDAAIAGGVDLSIDPFEVIGFAKTGALAKSDMRVYDRNSNGFWPGEGCGMLVLMREEDAKAAGLRSYATIAGWGYASDGKGGITRPEADGHRLAIERAYRDSGFDIGSVSYLEGHGTGTAVGDATELRAFSQARREALSKAGREVGAGAGEAGQAAGLAAISTVKGNIGHTKAAAGVAGLIKATLAVHHQVIPPATGHHDPHPELTSRERALRVPSTAELWPAGKPVRAGVSAMGFGGINTHIVVQSSDEVRRPNIDPRTIRLVRSRQDQEILLLDATSPAELRHRASHLAELSAKVSFAELGDLAATLEQQLAGRPVRAAVVAGAPEDAARRFGQLASLLETGSNGVTVDFSAGVFLGAGSAIKEPRIGFLFPGQGSGQRNDGGALARRFEAVAQLYKDRKLPTDGDLTETAAAQPRIVVSSLAGLRVLAMLGIEATAAAGHSLGELTGLHWAGAMDERSVIDLATVRGREMSAAGDGNGAMASLAAGPTDVEPMLRDEPVVIAGYNGPAQTVISGPADAVERVCVIATKRGLLASRLPVSHAFHSPLIAPAVAGIAAYLDGQRFEPLTRQVWSTSTSELLPEDTDVPDLLVRQVLEPVRFHQAVQKMAADVDLLIEVGPGRVLSGLAASIAPATPVISLDTDGASIGGLLSATAAAYVLGAPVRHDLLFGDRFTKPLPIDKQFKFFVNPCELAPDEAAIELTGPAASTPTPARVNGHDDASATTITTADGSLEVLRQLMAQRAELPLDSVHPTSLPLDDLHFSSITVGQIVNQAAREMGIAVPAATASFATATVGDLAEMLDDLASTDQPGVPESSFPDGVAPWVRAFATELVAQPAPPRTAPAMDGEWQVFATPEHPLATPLAQALRTQRLGDGVLLCLPLESDERHVPLMLDAARAALTTTTGRFVVVGGRRGAAGLAKTLHLEAPAITTTVVILPELDGAPVAGIVADVAGTTGFAEVHYDQAGTRRVPLLRPLPEASPSSTYPLGAGDVLLVTGGGKGITAECALVLARETGAAIALLGRSDPAEDTALAANLNRMRATGVAYHYARADVTNPAQVAAAVAEITAALGPVTGLLHGAGRNEPMPLTQLDEAAFAKTLAPKINGFDTVLHAIDPANLKLLVTFGSIIGRAGLRGQADYATANDWLTELTADIGARYENCRCVALEWSVWAGAGMGERLGVLEALARDGISPVSVDDGVAILLRLIARDDLPTALVVMGRAGDLPTITLEPRELPLARFLDRPRVYYPGIELVADSELSADNDPYLPDHLLDGELLYPAVLGIEAMSQAASALVKAEGPPVLEDVTFIRPIVVPVGGGSTTIRVAALNRGDRVDVVIRSSETDFQADHFKATLLYQNGIGTPATATELLPPAELPSAELPSVTEVPLVPLDPARDLYGSVLFQGKRFAHVQAYRSMAATSCVVEISAEPVDGWFSAFFPSGLVLGNPGPRDAFMHAIQCCVPDATLLPQGVERIVPGTPRDGVTRVVLAARERSRDGDSYIYDLEVRDPDGGLIERWEGLGLRAVRKQDGKGPWVAPLLGPYLERGLMDLYPTAVAPRCVVEPDGQQLANGQEGQRSQTEVAVSRLLGRPAEVLHRADGKPELADGTAISASHSAGLTFAVSAADGHVSCDAELVAERSPDDWELLLGAEHFALAELTGHERGENLAVAATRVWSAMECLRKLGQAIAAPITLGECPREGWALFVAGDTRIATFVTSVRATAAPVVFATATQEEAGR